MGPRLLAEVASQPQFVDAQHGWLYITRASGIGLYGTTDGGRHWRRVYARSSGAYHFFDRSNGVLFDADGWVEQTVDGGRTWDAVGLLPAFSDVSVAGMAFFGRSRQGVSLVWRPDGTGAVLLTDDAAHWRPAGRIPLLQPFSLAANSQVALLVDGGAARMSPDGGRSWEPVDFRYFSPTSVVVEPTSVAVEGDSLVVGYSVSDDGVTWHQEFPPLALGQFHHPVLFYATDETPFVVDSFLLDQYPSTRLFVAGTGSWRLVKLP